MFLSLVTMTRSLAANKPVSSQISAMNRIMWGQISPHKNRISSHVLRSPVSGLEGAGQWTTGRKERRQFSVLRFWNCVKGWNPLWQCHIRKFNYTSLSHATLYNAIITAIEFICIFQRSFCINVLLYKIFMINTCFFKYLSISKKHRKEFISESLTYTSVVCVCVCVPLPFNTDWSAYMAWKLDYQWPYNGWAQSFFSGPTIPSSKVLSSEWTESWLSSTRPGESSYP